MQQAASQEEAVLTLVLDDGQRVALDDAVVLGRAPTPEAGARPVRVSDPERTVSKTHVRVDCSGVDVLVTDLASTNGVRISWPQGQESWLSPGEPARLGPGARVHLGARSFVIEHPAPVLEPVDEPPSYELIEDLINEVPADGDSQDTVDDALGASKPDAAAPVLGIAERVVVRLSKDAQEAQGSLDAHFARVFAAAIQEAAAQAQRVRRVKFEPRLVPANVLSRTDGKLLGEGGNGRIGRSQEIYPAAFVRLDDQVLLSFLDDEGVSHLWMHRAGIARLAHITQRTRWTKVHALEWRYSDALLGPKAEGQLLERVVALFPRVSPTGRNVAWQSQLHEMLGPAADR
jgi:hypothetical protein